MSYLSLVIAFLAGVALGGVVFSLVVASRARARQAELEARAGSAEAVVTELRQQFQQGRDEALRLQAELDGEREDRKSVV